MSIKIVKFTCWFKPYLSNRKRNGYNYNMRPIGNQRSVINHSRRRGRESESDEGR